MANNLLLESGDRLLLETGDKLLPEDQAGTANTGTAAVALAATSASSAARIAVRAAASIALDAASAACAGATTIRATASVGLAPAATVAGGRLALRGSVAVSLTPLSAVATGGSGAIGTAAIGLAGTALAAVATIAGTGAQSPSVHLGGGWSAHEFARLRRKLARKKHRLQQIAAATLESLPRPQDGDGAEAIGLIARRIEAVLAQIEAATTLSAVRDIQGRLYAARAALVAEIDDEEILLLAA